MRSLHVGRGLTRGALTLFPVWGALQGDCGYTTASTTARIGERTGSDRTPTLVIGNPHDKPLLLVQGQAVAAGGGTWIVARSLLLAMRAKAMVEVSGGPDHVGRVDRVTERARALAAVTSPRPDQVGVVVGIAGRPVYAEVFDTPSTFSSRFKSIVAAAALNAVEQRRVRTPVELAWSFVQRGARVPCHPVGAAGLGLALRGEDEDVEVSVLRWRGRDVHLVMQVPRPG
jgi:hypothetical protein